jgi:signal transduction histidine kinase
METNQYVFLPFPYFCMNEDLEILTSSIDSCMMKVSFANFLDAEYINEFRLFLYNAPESESKVFFLFLQEKFSPHRLYKKRDNQGIYHLFCHPLESVENVDQIETMRQALHQTRLQLVKNKEDFDKMRKEYDEITIQSSYLTNIGQLAAGIAHEIRNPLTTIRGFIQLIKPYLSEVKKEEYATIALEEIDRANNILYQFLNAAKPQMNHIRKVNLNVLLKEISLLYEGEANIRNIRIETRLDPNEPYLLIDENSLKQVLVNIVKNAMDAISEVNRNQGEISLCSEMLHKEARITIIDNGCGMSAETLEKIFSPFYSTKTTGTGLGLSICKKIIDNQGGNIQIKSHLGEGTSFIINLPLETKVKLHA